MSFEDIGEFLSYESSFEAENDSELAMENENLRNENQSLKEQLDKYNNEKELKEKENRLKEYREYANALLTNPEGSIITPSQVDGLIDILEKAYLADNSNNKDNPDETGSVELIKNFMSSLKPVFSTSEFASKQKFSTNTKEFNASGKNVSAERLRLHERAKEIQAETPGISYEEAVCVAQREL